MAGPLWTAEDRDFWSRWSQQHQHVVHQPSVVTDLAYSTNTKVMVTLEKLKEGTINSMLSIGINKTKSQMLLFGITNSWV